MCVAILFNRNDCQDLSHLSIQANLPLLSSIEEEGKDGCWPFCLQNYSKEVRIIPWNCQNPLSSVWSALCTHSMQWCSQTMISVDVHCADLSFGLLAGSVYLCCQEQQAAANSKTYLLSVWLPIDLHVGTHTHFARHTQIRESTQQQCWNLALNCFSVKTQATHCLQ